MISCRKAILLMFLASCSQQQQRPSSARLPDFLAFRGQEQLKAAANSPYESSAIFTYENGKEAFLKILSGEEPNTATAKKKIRQETASLARSFQKQIDPYYGLSREASKCTNPNNSDLPAEETPQAVSKKLHYQANRYFQVTSCESRDYFYEVASLLLYCKKSKRIFTIRSFYRGKNAKNSPDDFSCRD